MCNYQLSVCNLRAFSATLQQLKDQINVLTPHLLETSTLGHFIPVRQNVLFGLLSQRRRRVQVGRVKDAGRVLDRNGLQHALLAHGFQSRNAKKGRRLEYFHGVGKPDDQLVRVQVLEDHQKDTVPHRLDANGVLGRFPHLTQKERFKVRAPHQQQLVGVHGPSFDHKGHIRQTLVVDQQSQVGQNGRGRNLKTEIVHGKIKLDEGIQPFRAVVPTKHVHAIVVADGHVTKAVSRLIGPGGVHGTPPRRLMLRWLLLLRRWLSRRTGRRRRHGQLQFVQIVHGAPAAAAKHVHAVAVHDAHVRIARNRRRAVRQQCGPRFGVKIKDKGIRQVPRAVVAAVENHPVLVDGAGGAVAGPRSASRRGHGAPP